MSGKKIQNPNETWVTGVEISYSHWNHISVAPTHYYLSSQLQNARNKRDKCALFIDEASVDEKD